MLDCRRDCSKHQLPIRGIVLSGPKLYIINCFHVHECGIELEHKKMCETVVQSVLIAMSTFSNVESLIKFVETLEAEGPEIPHPIHHQKDKYRMFLKQHARFPDNKIPKEYVVHAQLSYSYLMHLPAVKKFFDEESHQRFLMHLVLKHNIVEKHTV